MSSFFLLIIVAFSPNGSRSVSTEKFESHYECFQALKAVSDRVPQVTGYCEEIKRGE